MNTNVARLLVVTAVAAAAIGAPAREAVHAQTSADLFDRSVLHDVQVIMHPKDLALLRQTWQLNTFYLATLQIGSMKIRPNLITMPGWIVHLAPKSIVIGPVGAYAIFEIPPRLRTRVVTFWATVSERMPRAVYVLFAKVTLPGFGNCGSLTSDHTIGNCVLLRIVVESIVGCEAALNVIVVTFWKNSFAAKRGLALTVVSTPCA